MSVNFDLKPRRKELYWREYKSKGLIHPGFALNEVGLFIWKLCDGKHTIKDIVSAMLRNYDIERKTVETDVLGFLHRMEELSLIFALFKVEENASEKQRLS